MLRFSATEERLGSRGRGSADHNADPGRDTSEECAADVRQTTSSRRGSASSTSPEAARARFGRIKLNAVKDELRRAELAFVSAKRHLAGVEAQQLAGRVADALGRANCALDSLEKGAAAHPAVEALEGVFRFDPADRLADFLILAPRSVALAARVLANCPFDSVAYWGRTLTRLTHALTQIAPARKAS